MARPKLAKLVQKRVRVILTDGRQLHGKLLAFDGYMNVVLDETQEIRKTKAGEPAQRALGLVMLRGDMIVSTVAESPNMGKQGARLATQPITMQL